MRSMLLLIIAVSTVAGAVPSVHTFSYDEWTSFVPGDPGADGSFREGPAGPSGKPSAVIEIPAGSTPSWHSYQLDMPDLEVGALYELRGQARMVDLADGVGALVSLGALDEHGVRFLGSDSERVREDRWTPLDTVLFVGEAVKGLRVSLFLNGTGTAYFDGFALTRLSTAPSAAGTEVRVAVSSKPTTHEYLGFGLEDDSFFFTDENYRHGVDEKDIALRERRIADLDPAVVAQIIWWDAFNPAHDLETLTFDTELMRAIYRSLAPHQAAGRTVVLADVHWGWTAEQFSYSVTNVRRGVAAYLAFLKHLIQEKGFDCVKVVSVSGEVDMRFAEMGGSFASYVEANRLLRAGLDEAGLTGVRLIGDKVSGTAWFERAIHEADAYFGVFTLHEYPDVTQYPIIDRRLENALAAVRRTSKPLEADDGGTYYKPTFLWEIGFFDRAAGDTDSHQSAVKRFGYGLRCANTCNAALNHGIAGGSVWCLHGMYYPGQNRMDFGFWDFKDKDWRIRPFYYAYGLYTRFARPGMTPLRVTVTPSPYDFSAAALRGDKETVFFLNNLSHGEVTCATAGIPEGTYTVYAYEEDRLPAHNGEGYGLVEKLNTGRTWRPSDGVLKLEPESLVMLRARPSAAGE